MSADIRPAQPGARSPAQCCSTPGFAYTVHTLGYPQAALFGFCLALVAFNLYAVVMAALRAAHPEAKVDETVSEYCLAAEIARTTKGLDIAVEQDQWEVFAQVDQVRF